jgi:hypothetical protein
MMGARLCPTRPIIALVRASPMPPDKFIIGIAKAAGVSRTTRQARARGRARHSGKIRMFTEMRRLNLIQPGNRSKMSVAA